MRLLAWVAAVCCAAAASAAAPSATGVAAPDALAQGVGGSLDAHRHAHESGIRAMMRMMRESGTHPSAVSFVVGVGAHIHAHHARLEAEVEAAAARALLNAMAGATGASTGGAGGTGGTGGTGSAAATMAGQEASTGATGTASSATGATGIGHTTTGPADAFIGATGLNAFMHAHAATGATESNNASAFEEEVADVLSPETIAPSAESPEKASASLVDRVKHRVQAAIKAVKDHEHAMSSAAHVCEKKVANLTSVLADTRARVGESARHMLDTQRGIVAPMVTLKDALPVLQNYAYVLSNANASARIEVMHLRRERASIQSISSYVDYMQDAVRHAVETSFFPTDGEKGKAVASLASLSDAMQESEDRVSSALSDLAYFSSKDVRAHATAKVLHKLEKTKHDDKEIHRIEKALALLKHRVSSPSAAAPTRDLEALHLALRSAQLKIEDHLQSQDRPLALRVLEERMLLGMSHNNSSALGTHHSKPTATTLRLLASLRARVDSALKQNGHSIWAVKDRFRSLKKALDAYVDPIRALMAELPANQQKELHALDGMRSPHHALEQERDSVERELEAIRESCVGAFHSGIAEHTRLLQRQARIQHSQLTVWNRLSVAQLLWEHVKARSEEGAVLRQGASAAHNLVQKTLERALTLDPDRVTAGPDMALAPIPEGDIETLHEAQASLDAVVAQGTSVLGPIEAAVGKASEDTELAEGEATKALGRARNATRAMYRSKHRAGDATIEIESASEAQTYAKAKAAASTAHLAALLVELRKNQHALGTQVDVDNNGMRRTIIALQNKRIALQKEEWRLKNMISKLKKEAAKDTNGTANNATRDSASAASTEAASEAAVLTAEAEVADAKSDVDTAVKDINDAWAEENSMSLLQEQERSKTRQNTQGRRLRARAVLRYDAADEILASEGDRLTGLEKQLGMLTPEQQQQHHRFAGQATTAAATPAGEASVENANDVLAKKVSKLEKLRARRPNATAVWAGEGSGGEGKQHEGVLFSGRNSLKEVLVARQVVEAKIQQIRQDMQNVSLRSRNATALAKQVMVVQRQIKRARGLDSFCKKEIVLTTARKAKADAYVRECMADIAHSTSAYEGAMVALRKARDVVTRTKRRLYLLEKELSSVRGFLTEACRLRFPETIPAPDSSHVCCRANNEMQQRCDKGPAGASSSATGGAASSILATVPQYSVFNKHVDLAEQDAELARVAKAKTFESEENRMSRLKKKIPEETLLKLYNREEQTDKNLEAFKNFSANAFKLGQLEAAQQAASARDEREHDRREQIETNKHSVEENAAVFATEQVAAEVSNSEDALLEESMNEQKKRKGDSYRSISSSGVAKNPYLSVLSDDYAEVALGIDRTAAQKERSLERNRKSADDALILEREAEKAFRRERTAQVEAGSDQWMREHHRGTHITISE